jgi:predicted aminopeptidase
LLLSGCSSLSYYSQSVFGHLGLMMQREDIPELLEQGQISDELKQKLRFVIEARRFATEVLSLPDNGSYTSYVDTKQPFVVWNVVAAAELSLDLKKWCFVFAGCISYKGYYAEKDALQYATTLKHEGLDVYVRGATAYSTLGWFDDPVLNTFIKYPEPNLAGIIFHELAHQKLYIKNDSAFNEGFATLVEKEGVRRWLANRRSDPAVLEKYQQRKDRRLQFNRMIVSTNDRLRKLYASTISDSAKREQKNRQKEQLRLEYGRLKKQWGDYAGYDKWMAKELNNAQLGSVSTYQDLVPALQQLLTQNNNDLDAFYIAAQQLGELDPEVRKQKLAVLGGSNEAN